MVSEDVVRQKPTVKLLATLNGDEMASSDLGVYGAMGCFLEDSSAEAFNKDKASLSNDEFLKKRERIMRETSGRGHGSVLDQNAFTFSLDNVTRATTLLLCAPEYLMHLQQSLRRASATRGYRLPDSIISSSLKAEAMRTLDNSFELYQKWSDAGVPVEDARMALPLYTKTSIQTTGNARELMHLHYMSLDAGMPSVIKDTVQTMVDAAAKKEPALLQHRKAEYYDNYEPLSWFPSSSLFSFENMTMDSIIKDKAPNKVELLGSGGVVITPEAVERAIRDRDLAELANLKHLHFTFLVPMSLIAFHQATRQRTWNQSVETAYSVMDRGVITVPPKLEAKGFKQELLDQAAAMRDLYYSLVDDGVPKNDAIGVMPHGFEAFVLVHMNGWNAIHSLAKRTCFEAQWEIQKKAMEMALLIKQADPILGKFVEPQGRVYGKCPERKPCGFCPSNTSLRDLYDRIYRI